MPAIGQAGSIVQAARTVNCGQRHHNTRVMDLWLSRGPRACLGNCGHTGASSSLLA